MCEETATIKSSSQFSSPFNFSVNVLIHSFCHGNHLHIYYQLHKNLDSDAIFACVYTTLNRNLKHIWFHMKNMSLALLTVAAVVDETLGLAVLQSASDSYPELSGRAFYITQWQSEFRPKMYLQNEIWSKCHIKIISISNELVFCLVFLFIYIFSDRILSLISVTLISPPSSGLSVSGVIWQCLFLCCPCVSGVSRGCRSAGSVTATS